MTILLSDKNPTFREKKIITIDALELDQKRDEKLQYQIFYLFCLIRFCYFLSAYSVMWAECWAHVQIRPTSCFMVFIRFGWLGDIFINSCVYLDFLIGQFFLSLFFELSLEFSESIKFLSTDHYFFGCFLSFTFGGK